MSITFLGPWGSTFSHLAYDKAVEIFCLPEACRKNYIPANSNKEVLELVTEHQGYGLLAVETLTGGRINEGIESFIRLFTCHHTSRIPPIKVIGAVTIPLDFAVLTLNLNKTRLESIRGILGHEKAIEACKENINKHGWEIKSVSSNGEAARLVAEEEDYQYFAALAPATAVEQYSNLTIRKKGFQYGDAWTTFVVITGQDNKARHHPNPTVISEYRAMITYSLPHKPGSLLWSLLPWQQAGHNLRQIHSAHVTKNNYHFIIEIELGKTVSWRWKLATKGFGLLCPDHWILGPFPVISV